MGWFKKLFSNKDKEEVAKAASSANGEGTKHTTPKKGVAKNDTHKRDVTKHHPSTGDIPKRDVPIKGTPKQCIPKPDGTKHPGSSTDSPKQQPEKVILSPGFHEAWEANQLWDKNKKAEAVKLYEQALALGFKDDDKPFFHLGCYYMERKDWKKLKRILAITPNYMHRQRWYVEGQQLVEANLGKMPNGWIDIERDKTANGETWQEQYERMTSTFPLFDFDGKYEDEIREEDVKALDEFTKGLKRKLREAQVLVARKDYRAAAELLAEFVRNGYWKPEPYDMLMDIYHIAGLEAERRRLAAHSIIHFSQLRDRQRNIILRYATAEGCRDRIEEYMDEGNFIYYGDGLFPMYSPYPETEKWQKLIGG